MLKIVFVIGLTESGGAEKRAILISELLKSNFNTKVFAFSGENNGKIDYVFKPSYSEYKKVNVFRRIKALRKYLEKEKPDFVFSFVPHINMITTLALNTPKLKFIKHIVAMVFHRFRLKNMMLLKYSINKADAVYYQCDEQKDFVKCKCDSFVLCNPIKPTTEINRSFRMRFMSVGRLEDQKNYLFQIEEFAKIHNHFPESTLDIYGSGSQKMMLLEKIKASGLEKSVFIHDYCRDIDVQYDNHDIFLFTTKYEGFPNALMEAMSHGLICFSTNFSTGCKELIIDNKTGFICNNSKGEYSAKVIKILSAYTKAQDVAICGRKYVLEKCNIDDYVNSLTEYLLRLKIKG